MSNGISGQKQKKSLPRILILEILHGVKRSTSSSKLDISEINAILNEQFRKDIAMSAKSNRVIKASIEALKVTLSETRHSDLFGEYTEPVSYYSGPQTKVGYTVTGDGTVEINVHDEVGGVIHAVLLLDIDDLRFIVEKHDKVRDGSLIKIQVKEEEE